MGKYDNIIIKQIDNVSTAGPIFSALIEVLQPNGDLRVLKVATDSFADAEFTLKTSGFVNITKKVRNDFLEILCNKPSYEVGSSSKLTLKKPVENVWKLDDTVDDDIIDADELLDEEDFQKPDPTSLRGNVYRVISRENQNTLGVIEHKLIYRLWIEQVILRQKVYT